jgi:hypothetical protein
MACTKLLVNCSQSTTLINPHQTTFILERQILDGCIITNEVINGIKRGDQNRFLLKVDFNKAVESVN